VGVEQTVKSFRLSEHSLKQLDELQRTLSPFAETHSHVVRIALALLHDAVVVSQKVKLKELVLQKITSNST
jgi:hypothetical protein